MLVLSWAHSFPPSPSLSPSHPLSGRQNSNPLQWVTTTITIAVAQRQTEGDDDLPRNTRGSTSLWALLACPSVRQNCNKSPLPVTVHLMNFPSVLVFFRRLSSVYYRQNWSLPFSTGQHHPRSFKRPCFGGLQTSRLHPPLTLSLPV